MKTASHALAAACLLALAAAAQAQMSPVGLWKTIDDETGKEKSFVRIADSGGAVAGRIERVLDAAKADATCLKCTDERKDTPVLGMQILSGAKKTEGDAVWEGGQILDPNNGKTYKVRLKPVEDGKKLEVRGYIGPFYRTQTWLRAE